MRVLDRIRHAWHAVVRRDRAERDVDEELRVWVAELTARYRARGYGEDEARRRALADIGGLEPVKQLVRDERPGSRVGGWIVDLRYAARALRRAPAFTATVILTLALGIGATTAIFSVVHALILAPLPFRDPGRLVVIWSDMTSAGYPRAPLSAPELTDLRERSTTLEGAAAIWGTSLTLTEGDPEQWRVGLVTANFFPLVGAGAMLGRTFDAADDHPGPSGILLSWATWSRRFGADPSIVGRRISVNGQPTTVIGVMPQRFRLWMPPDAAVPDDLQAWTMLQSATLPRAPRGQQYLRVLGRMKPGVTIADARADVERVAAQISKAFAEYGPDGRQFIVAGLQADDTRELRPTLWSIFGAVLILAVIACVNVANLIVARAAGRRGETAMRVALGASRGRLARECLAEAVCLTTGGALAGIGVASLGLKVLLAWRPPALDRIAIAGIDLPVLAFTIVLSISCALVFSLVPLVDLGDRRLAQTISRTMARLSRSPIRTRRLLIVAQVALGFVLAVGAGLLARTFIQVEHVDPGFRADGVITFRVAVPFRHYSSLAAINDVSRRVQASLASLPGVTGAGAISHIPFDDVPNWGGPYALTAGANETSLPEADYRAVTPGFLEETGVQLLAGRLIDDHDVAGVPLAVVVDDQLARRAWPSRSAVGQQILVDPGSSGHATRPATVVGVVHHLRLRSLVADLTDQVFFSARQVLRNPMAYAVRTSNDPTSLVPSIRHALSAIDPNLPISDVRLLGSYVADAASSTRFAAALAVVFAVIAALLAAIGTYGVLAFGVAERRHEFGLRLALGARPGQVIGLVLRSGVALGIAGIAIGLGGAMAAGRALRSQLYGVTPLDPSTYLLAIAIVGGVVLAASWLPARRAANSSPLETLRGE